LRSWTYTCIARYLEMFGDLPNDTAVEPRATGPLADYETTSTAPSRDAAVHGWLGSQRPSSSKRPLGGLPSAHANSREEVDKVHRNPPNEHLPAQQSPRTGVPSAEALAY
jgi:hypothetical protein